MIRCPRGISGTKLIICGCSGSGVVGAAIEWAVTMAEDEIAAVTGAFAGGDSGDAPLLVGADIADVFFA